jgi:hypothetical protein
MLGTGTLFTEADPDLPNVVGLAPDDVGTPTGWTARLVPLPQPNRAARTPYRQSHHWMRTQHHAARSLTAR